MNHVQAARPLLALLLAAPLVGCYATNKVDKERKIEIYTEMAQGYYVLGEMERCKDQAMKGLELSPNNYELKLVLARAMIRSGRREEIGGAEVIFRDLLRSDDYRPSLGLAYALEREGQFFEEAAAEIEAGRRYTDAADPNARAAEHHASARAAWEEAVQHYLEVVEQQPNDRDAMNGLQRTHVLLGNLEEALVWSRALIATAAKDLEFWRKELLRPDITASDERRFKERERALVELIISSRLAAYTILAQLGREEEAVAELDHVLSLSPEHVDAYSRRAELQHRLGRYSQAIEDIDQYLRLTDAQFDDPDVQRAYELRDASQEALRRSGS